jgi:AcrR family transcriptional regulator
VTGGATTAGGARATGAGATSSGAGGGRVDGRVARGDRTRAAVLRRAADIASVEGLDGLSLGRLAAEVGVSKAGVFAHFGSKEQLQLATIGAAADRFTTEVIAPVHDVPDGLARLAALCTHWMDYCRRDVFPGGCFFFSAFADYDAKPGRVRDELASARWDWLGMIEALVGAAQRQGELDPAVDPAALAFELDALGMIANLHVKLCDDPTVLDRARESMLDRLRRLAIGAHPALA